MSHIVSIKTQVKDEQAVRAACNRLQLPQPQHGTFKLFTQTRSGLGVQLPNWSYPVVCDLGTGELAYDNYNGHWGEQRHLDSFMQSYAVEKTRLEAAKQGYSVYEEALVDGSVKVNVVVEA